MRGCWVCKEDLQEVKQRKLFYGYVVYLKCSHDHQTIEWRATGIGQDMQILQRRPLQRPPLA